MNEMMLGGKVGGGGEIVLPIKLKIPYSSSARTESFSGQGMTVDVSFNVPGTQTLSYASGGVSTLPVTIPANAGEIYFTLHSNDIFDPLNTFYTRTGSIVTEVIDWGMFDPNLTFSMRSCSQLTKVPVTGPHWFKWDSLFRECSIFNQDISMWSTSHVTSMIRTFSTCTAFNRALPNWDVSNVLSMDGMFDTCSVFNQSLANWSPAKVTDMNQMFRNCSAFNQSLNLWDTDSVVKLDQMFYNCGKFNQPLNNWNVSNVTTMPFMFGGCTIFNQNLSNLTFPQVTLANRNGYDWTASTWAAPNRPAFAITT